MEKRVDMQKLCSVIFGFFVLLLTVLIYSDNVSFAQVGSSGIATYVQVEGDTLQPGDIVSFSQNGYRLSSMSYDPDLFGVIVEDPSISFEAVNLPGAVPIVSNGKAFVRVSDQNGSIQSGDLITSSSTPGVGQKATEEGYVIGVALDSVESGIQLIPVQVSIRFNATTVSEGVNLLSGFGRLMRSETLSPISSIRYILAFGSILIAFLLALFYFGRIITTGIEAIGRNPMGGKYVLQSIALNVLLSVVILAVAFALSYFILVVV